MSYRYLLGAACIALSAGCATAQDPSPTPPQLSLAALEEIILAGDDRLFIAGFNDCQMDVLQDTLSDDVVMVHDQAGRTSGLEAFLVPVRANICSGEGPKPLRRLDPDATEIYPLYENGELYGALQVGRHSFYLKESDAEPFLTNRARFVTEWTLASGAWQVKTAYSYDHMNPTENHPIDTDVLQAGFDQQDTIEFMMQAHLVKAQSVAIIRNGRLAEVRNFGEQSAGVPVSLDTMFNAASLAKPVSALVALKLIDAGKLGLDETLAPYDLDPDIADEPEAQRATVRHVLSHSSGLPNWRYLSEENQLAFGFEPGEGFDYSGEGFEWLRRAIEAKTGRSLESLAAEYVFGPAGMRSTSYIFPTGDAAALVADRYDESGQQIETVPHIVANAAANLITTAEDYGRFVAYVMSGADLDAALADEMFEGQIEQSEFFEFALGWQKTRGTDFTAFQHSGSDPGVRSLALFWPDSGDGIVILSNSDGALQTWQKIITELYGARGWDVLKANGR